MAWLKAALFCLALANFSHGFKYPARPAYSKALPPRSASPPFKSFPWPLEASGHRRELGLRRAVGDDDVEGDNSEKALPEDALRADALLEDLMRELTNEEEELAETSLETEVLKQTSNREEEPTEVVQQIVERQEPLVTRRTPEEGLMADALLDEMVRDLTEEKEKLAEKGEYEKAREVRDRMRVAHLEEGPRVLARNAEFYRAFSDSDISYMKELWERAPDVSCIHPGVTMRVGYNAVIRKWESMFQGHKESSAERFSVRPGNVRVFVRGTTAVVTCEERLYRKGAESTDWVKQALQSTNIFRRSYGEWRMVHHHASPVSDNEKRGRGQSLDARRSDGMQVLGPFEVRPGQSLNLDAIREAIRNKLQGGTSGDGFRIISVNGGSIDNDDGDTDDDMNGQGVDDVAAALSKKIREALGDSRDGDESSSMMVRVGKANLDEDDHEDAVGDSEDVQLISVQDDVEEDVRKETVSLIRRLSTPEEGRLTARQKQLLLGDVIRAAADRPSRKSLVEVAYTILIDRDVGEEALDEFAEQCVLLAEELEDLRQQKS